MEKKTQKLKMLIVGGHLTPALAVMEEFFNRGILKENIVWVGHKFTMIGDENPSAEFNEIKSRNVKFVNLITGKLYRTSNIKAIISFLRIPIGLIQSFFILLTEKPDFIMSFGGYLAAPISFWGKVLGIPIFTHEQTLTVGRANKFIQNQAEKVFLSWNRVYNSYLSEDEKKSDKFIVTGNPIRREVFEKRTDKFDFNNGKKTIYITGGNQGSHRINAVVGEILPELLEKYNVIHQCGSTSIHDDIETLTELRSNLPDELKKSYVVQTGFWQNEIGAVFANSDLVISRSGANSISEMIALKKPCVLIPIPWTAGNEQVLNAKMIEDLGLAVVLEQKDLNKETLLSAIEKAFSIDKESIEKVSARIENVTFPDAEKRIVEEVMKEINK